MAPTLRVAFALRSTPRPTDTETPELASSPAVRDDWLGSLTAFAAGTAVDRAMARLCGLSVSEPTTVAVTLVAHETLSAEEAEALNERFAAAERLLDEELEQLMVTAYHEQEEGRLEAARQCYLDADALLEREVSARRALVQVSLGELERAAGRPDAAVGWLNRALAMVPDHISALRGRAAIAIERRECATAAAMLGRLEQQLDDPDERVELLRQIADQSLRAAEQATQEALRRRPHDRDLLERLHAVLSAGGQWDRAVGVAVQLAEGLTDARERARALVQAAKTCSQKARNPQRAVALFEAAIEDDPEVPEAFASIEAELVRAGDSLGLVSAYDRQIQRLASKGAEEARLGLLAKLGKLQTERLDDTAGALVTFERFVAASPWDLEARLALAALYSTTQQPLRAVEQLEVAARLSPQRAETYRELKGLFERCADLDRAFLSASVLVALGEADINEQLTHTQYASAGLLGFEGQFDEQVWRALAEPAHPFHLDVLAEALEPAATELWVLFHRERGTAQLPDKKFLESPKKSTVSAVRCFTWASRLIGLPEPALYLQPDNAQVSVGVLPSAAPALLFGRSALSGRSLAELVFMATRQLCYLRPCWRLLACWSEPFELTALLWAAIAVARPELGASLPGRGQSLRPKLAERLDARAVERLRGASEGIVHGGLPLDVVTWSRSVEQLACRAAFLASGDLSVAGPVLSIAGAPPGGLSAAERERDLLPFAVSTRFTELRRRLGVAVR